MFDQLEGASLRNPVETYFTQLKDIYSSGAGVAETSYYPALQNLLDSVGHGLKPRVSAIINLRNTGAGIPDGGLFTANQLKGWEPGQDPLFGQLPSRGAIEVKGTSDDAFVVAESEQVIRYVEKYGLVLVTNLRDFVLVGRSPTDSGTRTLESCRLAETEAGFWARVQTPRKFAEQAGEGLNEFLRRVLLHNAPLTDPKDLAWFLASYARTARLRLESNHELPALDALRSQLEDALGLKFEGDKGDHFFRSTLVQTLFYGMFASWVLWARDKDRSTEITWDRRFQWETASQTLHVPMVAELFYQFSNPGRLRELRIDEVLEWAEEILWRVDRTAFFERFREEHAVQYFYEPFLEAFDPELRKELGVWYTPDEVVQYMVARVDWALRNELGITDGLANPSVVVLDPCCGTGAFLVEVLRTIDRTLQAKGADALTRYAVKRAAMERIIGFEILPAPYVVAHLQIGLLLAELGVPLKEADERAGIYLTNSLTGWESAPRPAHPKVVEGQLHSTLLFPEFADERDAANRVKREEPIIVVLGNPPYNSYAGTSPDQEEGLVEPYKRGLRQDWGMRKYNLDDLYVRFIRVAERRVAELGGFGVMAMITNFSYLRDPSYVVMRKSLIDKFDSIWIDNMNGDSRETGKTTPSGSPDPSVFSTEHNREGIRVGTAICMAVRRHGEPGMSSVKYREFWGVDKRDALLSAIEGEHPHSYVEFKPEHQSRFILYPTDTEGEYGEWPTLLDLADARPQPGLEECRGGDLIDFNCTALLQRIEAYFDAGIDVGTLSSQLPGLMRSSASYDPKTVRDAVLAQEAQPRENACLPYLVRPFDLRVCYYSQAPGLWNRPRPALYREIEDNLLVISRMNCSTKSEGPPLVLGKSLFDKQTITRNPGAIPVWIGCGDARRANLSSRTREYLRHLKLDSPDANQESALRIWQHSAAIAYSPSYLAENSGPLASNWPRIPLPRSSDQLANSASLGSLVGDLLLDSANAEGYLRVGRVDCDSGGALSPEVDLSVTARWGITGSRGVTMPSTGKIVERDYADDEIEDIYEAGRRYNLDHELALRLVGETCVDIYLNDVAYWNAVPSAVWRYTIGGYQIIKKWLSYRENSILGRSLTIGEARYVSDMVHRIASLLLLSPQLDRNYEQVKTDTWDW